MESKVDETEKPFTKPGRKICTDHQEEDLRFFCLSCEVPICRDCKMITHDGHRADLVANVAKGMREKLVNILEKTELGISKLKEEAADTIEKADIKEEMVPNVEDTMNEIKNIANETKAEIVKLVNEIESEINLHDEEPNAERLRIKMANLVALKESLVEVLYGDYETVKAFKGLVEEDAKYSEEIPEDIVLSRNAVKEKLQAEFRALFGKIVEDIRNFDVKSVLSGEQYAENDDGSKHLVNVGVGVGQWFRSTAKNRSRIRFQSLRTMEARWSMDTCFWVLQMVFCSLPILQSVTVYMLLSSLSYNYYIHPVCGMLVSGICVSSAIFMLSGNSKLKYGVVSFAGVLTFFAFSPHLKDISKMGIKLILSRHQGCIGLYLIFAGRKVSSKAMETVGEFCTIGYVMSSTLILWDDLERIQFPGGKLGVLAVMVLSILLILRFVKDDVVKYVTMAIGCIVIASSLISKVAWYDNKGRSNEILFWTSVCLFVCNVSIVVGMLVIMEQEVTAIRKRLFHLVKPRIKPMGDHRD